MNSSQTLEEQTRFSAFGHQSQRFATLRLPDKVRLLEYGWDARKKHKWKHTQKCEKPGLPLPQFQFWQYQILFLKIFMISGIPIDILLSPSKRNECTCFGLQGNQQIDDLVISQGSWLPSLEWFHLQKCIPKESTSNPSERSGCCSRPERHFFKGRIGGQITSRTISVRIYKYHLYSNICLWNCKSSLFSHWKMSLINFFFTKFLVAEKGLLMVAVLQAILQALDTCTYTLCSHP